MKRGLAKAVLGIYMVSTFLFCVALGKENPDGFRFGVKLDAAALGIYCLSSAYPNLRLDAQTLSGETQTKTDRDIGKQDNGGMTLTGSENGGKDEQSETAGGKVTQIITTEDPTDREPVVFGEDPAVLIVHTHATESYLPSTIGNYHKKGKKNTVRDVGDVLAQTLEENGIGVVHDQTLHDDPSYNQSYNRSYETTEKLLKKYPSIICVIDLHRDAIASEAPAATVSVGGKTCAKYSYVVSNAVETYRDNLKFIQAMNRTAEKKYNGFTGKILERGYRYNQGLSSKYMLLEIGYNRNDIADCRNTAEYVGKILADTLKGGN